MKEKLHTPTYGLPYILYTNLGLCWVLFLLPAPNNRVLSSMLGGNSNDANGKVGEGVTRKQLCCPPIHPEFLYIPPHL